MILTGFRTIKPNASLYNNHRVTMVCTAIEKDKAGYRKHFFVLIHSNDMLGKQTTLGRVACDRSQLSDNSTEEERRVLEWIWDNVYPIEKEFSSHGCENATSNLS